MIIPGIMASVPYTAASGGYQAAVLADGPVFFYRCQELSGTTAIDTSGNSNNGTYTNVSGTPIALNAGSLLPSEPTANSAAYPGSGALALRSNVASPTFTGSLTFEWMMNASSLGSSNTGIICRANPNTGGQFQLRFKSSTSLDLIFTSFGDVKTFTSPISLLLSNVHCALTYDQPANTLTFYVNGVARDAKSLPVGGTNSGFFEIGGNTSGTPSRVFAGKISEFAYYNKLLTASQIATHFAETGL